MGPALSIYGGCFLPMPTEVTSAARRGIFMTQCDTCAYYAYDEEFEEYYCTVDMDEDDASREFTGQRDSCPYYRNGDEYAVVRHQM